MKTKINYTKPHPFHIPVDRRRFFKSMALASAGFTLSGYLAEALTQSPIVTQGPYYPLADDIPLDKDNDLAQVNDSLTAAAGVVTYVNGRVLDSNGNPIKNALVELWHADREGDYLYSNGVGRNLACDANFAGFGQFLTGASGAFRFRTIKAGLYAGITNAAQRASVLLDYTPVPGTTTGEVQTAWDFVSGFTPIEPTYPNGGSLIVAGTLVAGPTDASPRYRLAVPIYTNYTYEIYGNPTLSDLNWRALPFSLSPTGAIDRNKHTATSDGTLAFYVDAKAVKGFYKVSFRVPGANTGTP